jgi:hypothetical protein
MFRHSIEINLLVLKSIYFDRQLFELFLMSFIDRFNRFLFGDPLPNSAREEERLSNAAGLAILASDALSSVAYATEEILLVLVVAGSGVLGVSRPIAIAISILLGIVILADRQTIRAYPKGGGSYIVARENLGLYPGLVAAASLHNQTALFLRAALRVKGSRVVTTVRYCL